MNNVTKMATKDATDWAYAEMFFGEGAGTRRKLLNGEIVTKIARIPGYEEAFEKAYNAQDFGKHALNAAKERKTLDRNAKVKKNARGLLTGNRKSMTGVVLTGVTVYVFLKQTGLDEPLKEEATKAYRRVKTEYQGWKGRREAAKLYSVQFGDNTGDA